MNTKIKIPLVAIFLIPVAYLYAQSSDFEEILHTEVVSTYRAIYTYGRTGEFPTISVESERQAKAYTYTGGSYSEIEASHVSAPQPRNLEDVACLISDMAREQDRKLVGEASVQVLLDENGGYLSHRLISMEYTHLVAAVERQIDQLRFTPAQAGRIPGTCWVEVQFVFVP